MKITEAALRDLLRETLENEGSVGYDGQTVAMTQDDVPAELADLIVVVDPSDCPIVDSADDVGSYSDFGGGEKTARQERDMDKDIKDVVISIAREALEEANGLPFGFGKGKMKLGGQFEHPNDDEEGPHDDFRSRGGSVEDEFKADGTVNFDPDDDIVDPEEREEALLKKMTTSAWDPEDDSDDEEATDSDDKSVARNAPRKRIDIGTGYGVDGDTYDKIGQVFGWTKEGAKKAVGTATERFRVLQSMDPDDLEGMLMDGVDEYVELLKKTGELTPEDVRYMKQHYTAVTDSEAFREFFSKYVKRAVRDEIADKQDDEEEV